LAANGDIRRCTPLRHEKGERVMAKQLFRDGTEVVSFYVRAVRSGPFVFVSGTTSLDMRGRVRGKDAAEQTLITMRKIEAALRSAGARLRDLTRLTIFVTDIRDMGAVSKALGKVLKGSAVSATLVAVSALAAPGLLVEIESTAVVES
jgi:2-iminobutanoate/2-iminopropanoate deaminase